jgi:hypothetical protein
MTGKQTLRQRYLAAAGEIQQVYSETSAAIGYDGRQRVREAYRVLAELGTYLPDTEPGWLRYGDMPDDDIAVAVRRAEKGFASPAHTLELVRQVRKLREQLTALGGPYGVTDGDIRSMIAEGFHTAFRKATDSMESAIAWKAIRDMDGEEYREICRFVADPIIGRLREAEEAAKTAEAETPAWPLSDPELVQAMMRWAMSKGAIITREWFGLPPAENMTEDQETSS